MQYKEYPAYKDSGVDWLGDIPKGWNIRRLKFFSESVSTGTTPPSSNSEYYEFPNTLWYTPADFVNGSIVLDESKRMINSIAIKEGVVKKFREGSILVVGIGATLGKVALAQREFTCNQQINVIAPDKSMSPRFLAYSLCVKNEIMKMISNASTLGIMNQEKTKQVHLCAPLIEEQNKIADFIEYKTKQIDQLIEKKKALIEKLNEQRIAVITRAVPKGWTKPSP
ncbi:MAG: restriction endonuclease subunit S [Methylococcaceae bacterium]